MLGMGETSFLFVLGESGYFFFFLYEIVVDNKKKKKETK